MQSKLIGLLRFQRISKKPGENICKRGQRKLWKASDKNSGYIMCLYMWAIHLGEQVLTCIVIWFSNKPFEVVSMLFWTHIIYNCLFFIRYANIGNLYHC